MNELESIFDDCNYEIFEENKKDAMSEPMLSYLCPDIAKAYITGIYRNSKVVEPNISQAIFWLEKGAEYKDVDSQLCLAEILEKGELVSADHNKAFYWYQKAAELGSREAFCKLANCYDNGIGVEKNKEQAISWYEEAAKKHSPLAQLKLATHYFENNDLENLEKHAKQLADKDIEQGFMFLASIYIKNLNMVNAFYCLEKAAQTLETARNIIKKFNEEFSSKQILRIYQKLLEDKPNEANYFLGCHYFHLPQPNYEKAYHHFLLQPEIENESRYIALDDMQNEANKTPSPNAQANFYLGFMFDKGLGVKLNKKKALEHYKKALELICTPKVGLATN